MTSIKKKIGVLLLIICSILFAGMAFIAVQITLPTAVCTEEKTHISPTEFSSAMSNEDNISSGVVSPNCTCNAGNIVTGTI